MTLDELREAITEGRVDTVLIAMVDMQGRLMGKRCHAAYFIDKAWKETRCCDYLLATDLDMATPTGYEASSWEKGYGDYLLRPDLSTLRLVPWLEATALVLCDVLGTTDKQRVAHDPRTVLMHQIERARAMGLEPMAATELEFYLFAEPYEADVARGRIPPMVSGYNDDYSLLHTSRVEGYLRPLRNHLAEAEIPVECTKGEAGPGQVELNLRYGPALLAADRHAMAKHAAKELAASQMRAVSFMAKWHSHQVGSAAHVHLSLADQDGANICFDPNAEFGLSSTMRHFMAGLLVYGADCTYFYAPYVNSYKRFVTGSFAPTRLAWSVDNRTAGYRLCAVNGPQIRVECRIPGADMTPHLAIAAMLAAGLSGIEKELQLPAPKTGNIYVKDELTDIPKTLRDAATILEDSRMMRSAMGDQVVNHYSRAAFWEAEQAEMAVTDYDVIRGFERA